MVGKAIQARMTLASVALLAIMIAAPGASAAPDYSTTIARSPALVLAAVLEKDLFAKQAEGCPTKQETAEAVIVRIAGYDMLTVMEALDMLAARAGTCADASNALSDIRASAAAVEGNAKKGENGRAGRRFALGGAVGQSGGPSYPR